MRPARTLLASALAAFLPAAASAQAAVSAAGVLLLAHGGDRNWNETLRAVAAQVGRTWPTEVAFGMADGDAMQAAASKLAAGGATRIVAVPLFVSSYSSLIRHTAYLLRLSEEPSKEFLDAIDRMERGRDGHGDHGGHGGHEMGDVRRRIDVKASVRMTGALDSDPLVSQILAERARAMSTDAGRESLVLVAHGPLNDEDDRRWLAELERLGLAVKDEVPFREVRAATIRDDAPREEREAAVRRLRGVVERLSGSSEVLVVPVLLARGGIERKIPRDLDGLSFRWSGETLAPHPNLAAWVEKSVRSALEEKN